MNTVDTVTINQQTMGEALAEQAAQVEKLLCAQLGREWTPAGISVESLIKELGARSAPVQPTFQSLVWPWLSECFGYQIATDLKERSHRFYEESTELVQAGGMTADECHQLVDYTFNRPIGEVPQEIGGVMTTLAAFCLAHGQDMHDCAINELHRNWGNIEKIRAKQKAKPKFGPLPE